MNRPALVTLALVALTAQLLAAPPATAAASVITVGPGSSITAAINSAPAGSVIQLLAGTYTQNVEINARYVTLRGNAADPGSVILRSPAAGGVSPLFIREVPETSPRRVTIEGLTVTGGDSMAGQGGGITIAQNSSPELRNVIVTGNHARGYGGGIAIHSNASPWIHDSQVHHNSATSGGGGIFVNDASSPLISGNAITDNSTSGWATTNGGSSGGGIYLESKPGQSAVRTQPVVIGNTVLRNTATFAGGGVMVRTGTEATIEGNTIEANTAAYGGGIHLETEGAAVVVTDNHIASNSATRNPQWAGSGYGGGIAAYADTEFALSGNVIVSNTSSHGGAGIVIAERAGGKISGDLIRGNTVTSPGSEGGGIYVTDSRTVITNSLIDSNTAALGAGVALMNHANVDLGWSTIVRNTASTSFGGAVFAHQITAARIANNVFADNALYQIFDESTAIAAIGGNLFATGGTSTRAFYSYDLHARTPAQLNRGGLFATNASGDPRFTDGGDFSLRAGSAATSVTASTVLPPMSTDIRSFLRTGTTVGAYSYETNIRSAHAPTFSGEHRAGERLEVTGGSWGSYPATIDVTWYRDGSLIASGVTYTLTRADVGTNVTAQLRASKPGLTARVYDSPPAPAVSCGETMFADVCADHPFATEIAGMWTTGVSTGSTNDPNGDPLYRPSASVSRQAMASFLQRMSGAAFTPPTVPTFADVDPTHPFYSAIEWMAAEGISTGTPQLSGKPLYEPAKPVSRQAMAVFLARYTGVSLVPPSASSFIDVPVTASTAAAIEWMRMSGISTGYTTPAGTEYRPSAPVSRQAMAAFLMRIRTLESTPS